MIEALLDAGAAVDFAAEEEVSGATPLGFTAIYDHTARCCSCLQLVPM